MESAVWSRFYLYCRHIFYIMCLTAVAHCFLVLPTHIHSWNGAGLQAYFDAAISIILPFTDWYFQLQSSLSAGQIITSSLLNGYLTLRFYQKTLATVSVAQQTVTLKESVERECLGGGLMFLYYLLIKLKLTFLPLCRNRIFYFRSTLHLVSTHGQNCSQNPTRDQ